MHVWLLWDCILHMQYHTIKEYKVGKKSRFCAISLFYANITISHLTII